MAGLFDYRKPGREARMDKRLLDQVICVRGDRRLRAWIGDLASQAGREPSAFVRDLVFYLTVTDNGEKLTTALRAQNLDYSRLARVIRG